MCRMLSRSPDRILSYRNFGKLNVIESSNEKWKLMTKIFMKFEFNKSVFSAFWRLKTGKAQDNHFCFIPNPASPLIFIQTFTLEIRDKFLSGLVIQEWLYNIKNIYFIKPIYYKQFIEKVHCSMIYPFFYI